MTSATFAQPDHIRTLFSQAMSALYRDEVPQYGTLIELVEDVNAEYLASHPDEAEALATRGELERISLERHGAIRLGTAQELHDIRRLFAVMGMFPVGYYDLSVAGIPVHSTAFRPVDEASLRRNPFRVFTSLLRLELIEDVALRARVERILADRQIFSDTVLELVAKAESQGGLTLQDAHVFVEGAIQTFRWHQQATVDLETYRLLHDAHRLIADVVSFRGPHINHLTPRTLDIDTVQARMPDRGIDPKAVIEGPPPRQCPILLRQTSFKALEEAIEFRVTNGAAAQGTHTARFGEIEQRGVALTREGRARYDALLAQARADVQHAAEQGTKLCYETRLAEVFETFPDDWAALRREGLAFFRYSATPAGIDAAEQGALSSDIDALILGGYLQADPIIYEDFLPVSAAGIFQSNLGSDEQKNYGASSNQARFEAALGVVVEDELALYEALQRDSLNAALLQLGLPRR
ncbi:2-oxoadipate dioxygenase/decarboxylase HglS [Pseudomonas sp. Marseille-QA0892]